MVDHFTYKVFLSYSAKDKRVVAAIAKRLREEGLRVWLKAWQIGVRATKEAR